MGLRRGLATAVLTVAIVLSGVAEAAGYDVTVRRTAHGIPHITGKTVGDVGYGYGQAIAQDAICTLADTYVTVSGERSKFFGADGSYAFGGNGTTPGNLASDAFYKRIIAQGTVERLLDRPAPAGPVDEIRDGVRGYVAGYNAYLARVGVANLPDPACRGAEWVRPITEIDAYRRFYQLALLASAGVAIDGIGAAAPVTEAGVPGVLDLQGGALPQLDGSADELLGGVGSNAIALGRQAVRGADGLLLGNPHFPWAGSERFYQSHLTIPGVADVQGASLYGVPLILIGNTRGLAWSHTVSTARRFTPYQLTIAPGDQHAYLVDGRTERMTPTTVSVEVKQPDGSLQTVRRTLYDTRWGPMLTSILGLPLFPWTPATGFALGDANAANFRYLNHFWFTNQAQSVAQLDEIERRYQGIPWVNTIAADTTGKAYYADIGAVPGVTQAKLDACLTPLGQTTQRLARVQVLDGSRSACAYDDAPDAAAPGILGPSQQPSLTRDDYVTNGNDSHWLSNPEQPLEGFSPIIGDERTTRSLRTRIGLVMVREQLARGGFDLATLRRAAFDDRQYAGELWVDQLVALCEANPVLAGSSGPVDVSGACPVLRAWDRKDDPGSRGALLFRRFAARAVEASPYATPFDVSDPVDTPRGLATGSAGVRAALADAVTDLRRLGLPLDEPLATQQVAPRGSERIPIPGGPGELGVFNVISTDWDPARGTGGIYHGSSYVQAVALRARRCPTVRTILTYSQSPNADSRWYGDQTRLFSAKRWVRMPYCPAALARAKLVSWADYGRGAVKPLDRVRARRVRGGRARVTFRLLRPARVRIVGGGRVRRLSNRTHTRVVRVRSGARRVAVVARAGGKRYRIATSLLSPTMKR